VEAQEKAQVLELVVDSVNLLATQIWANGRKTVIKLVFDVLVLGRGFLALVVQVVLVVEEVQGQLLQALRVVQALVQALVQVVVWEQEVVKVLRT
jgi:hypothetical protein